MQNNSTTSQRACDQIRRGCDKKRRQTFHKHLTHLLTSNGYGNCVQLHQRLDIDRDGLLSEPEWMAWKPEWSAAMGRLSPNSASKMKKRKGGGGGGGGKGASRFGKCFTSEVVYCDQNDDGQVSLHEWTDGGCCPMASNTGNQLQHDDNRIVSATAMFQTSSSASSSLASPTHQLVDHFTSSSSSSSSMATGRRRGPGNSNGNHRRPDGSSSGPSGAGQSNRRAPSRNPFSTLLKSD